MLFLLAFVLCKYFLYCAVCYMAVRILDLPVKSVAQFAVQWAVVRLGIGFVSGFFVFQLFTALLNAGLIDSLSYVLSFGIARYLEWFIVLKIIAKRYKIHVRARGHLWILIGTLTNVITDQMVLATGVGSLRLFS